MDLAGFMSSDIPLRLGCAVAAGLLLGFERESHGRAAGVRTTVLVCLAASCLMVLSDSFYAASFDPRLGGNPSWHPDPARLSAGVLSGIGFIGGGVIVHQGNLVRGVTTAAVIWMVTAIGLCFGAGQYALGWSAAGLSFLALIVMPYVEKFAPNDWYATLTVKSAADGVTIEVIREILLKHEVRVKSVEWDQDVARATRVMKIALKFKKGDLITLPEQVVAEVSAEAGVQEVSWA
jgi:putative Mg2+ transporter-C (MgtC) family protein